MIGEHQKRDDFLMMLEKFDRVVGGRIGGMKLALAIVNRFDFRGLQNIKRGLPVVATTSLVSVRMVETAGRRQFFRRIPQVPLA